MKLSIEVLKSLIESSSLDYRKKNVVGKCPYCSGEEFGISVENNHLFGCYRQSKCGEKGNIFKLLKKLNRFDLLQNSENITVSSKIFLENMIIQSNASEIELPEIQPPVGFRTVYHHPYLEERGFREEDYMNYGVGITNLDYKLKDYIIFLIGQNHKLVGYVARYTGSKEEIKLIEEKTGKRISRYKNSTTDFENLLFGIDECIDITDTVILVEGLFGKRNVDEKLGLRNQYEIKCLCTFGAKISDSQIMLLHRAGVNNIILFYDPDVIGQIKKYSSRLMDEFDSVKVALITNKDKDPADLNDEEMIEVFDNLKNVLDFQLNVVPILNLK